jgi:hypothetical protein
MVKVPFARRTAICSGFAVSRLSPITRDALGRTSRAEQTSQHAGSTKIANRMAIYSTPEPSPKVINPPGGSSALVVAQVAVVAAAAAA